MNGLGLRLRGRRGWSRVRRAAVPVLVASAAAGVAFAVARYGLGHEFAFFAPVSAWVALGFSTDRQPRRVAELAVGVAVGVLAGDLLVHVIGTGAVQVALVLAVAALVARFVDRSDLLTTQAGVQAIVIVVLPATRSGAPVDRWLDALVGGVVALGVAALLPQDPRRRIRSLAQEAVGEITAVLRHVADGLVAGDPEQIEEALLRGRGTQPVLDQWRQSAAGARQAALVQPAFRRHRPELAALETAAVLADRAMRNTRVLARRCGPLVAAGPGAPHATAPFAALVAEVADATAVLAADLGAGGDGGARARAAIAQAAGRADPWVLAPDDWHVQGVVLLLRSLLVDLAEAAGTDPATAREHLPEI